MSAEPTRPPLCYGYARVSSERQAEEGLSLEVQKERILAFHDYALKGKGVIFADLFVDPGESAYKIPLSERKAGKPLLERLKPGDHIVFYRFDRAFRSVIDFCTQTKAWTQQGIIAHYLDMQMSTDTAAGMWMLQNFAGMAEFTSRQIGERVREAMQRRKARVGTGSLPPIGYKVIGRKHDAVMVPNEDERAIYKLAMILKDQGMSIEAIRRLFRERRLRLSRGAFCGTWAPSLIIEGIATCRAQNWTTPPLVLPAPRPPRETPEARQARREATLAKNREKNREYTRKRKALEQAMGPPPGPVPAIRPLSPAVACSSETPPAKEPDSTCPATESLPTTSTPAKTSDEGATS